MMEIFDFEQNTPEWFACRSGLPTSSEFHHVIAKKGPRGGIAKGRQKLLWRLAGEIITGEPESTYQNAAMERGHEVESEASDLYAMLRDVEPQTVGFVKNGNCGASPDRFIDDDGLLEIKSAIGSIQIERLLKGALPTEHVAQCQGQLMVTERKWLDYLSYCRGIAPLIVRVERDEEYIDALRIDIGDFVSELDELVTKIGEL